MDGNNVDPELKQFLEMQTRQAQLEETALQFADMCWKKCVDKPGTKTIGNGGDSRTEACLQNCVDRFFDISSFIVQRLQHKASSQ